MRLEAIQENLHSKNIPFTYWEENDSGSITFLHKGLNYHIWEYPAPERGAESNVRSAGRGEEFEGDYEAQILEILKEF